MNNINEARVPFNSEIFYQLAPEWQGHTFYFPVLPSTNEAARQKLRELSPTPRELLFIADLQVAGRGRLGRTWQAPSGSGILATVCFPLAPLSLERAYLFTAALALSVAKATTETSPGTSLDLKWPNDLLRDQLKVGGILAEVENNLGPDRNQSWIALGFGLNISLLPRDFREAGLSQKAANLAPFPLFREELLSKILKNFKVFRLQLSLNPGAVRDEWQAALITLGKQVKVFDSTGAVQVEGLASGVKEDGSLLVVDASGKINPVQAGDVSIRLPDGNYS